MVVETQQGRAVVAGQVAETADEFARGEPDERNRRSADDEPACLLSISRLRDLQPHLVYFSHDGNV